MTRTLPHNRIVVGVDGTAASDAALGWALREARLRRATLHLVCACHRDDRLRAPYAPWHRDAAHAAAAAVLAAAARKASRHLPPAQIITDLASESPVRALLDRAAGADMLVLGADRPARTPGQPAPALGPVARTCLRVARCPVVVIAPDDAGGQSRLHPAAAARAAS